MDKSNENNGSDTQTHCYCTTQTCQPDMIRCRKCQRYFHTGCLKSGNPTTLAGDVFYHLTCAYCADDGTEECERMKLQWLQVVMLALYNLQLTNTGKRGYFRWKEHICAFIDRHWFNFFGQNRKKTTTWFGTVAGILSSNRPTYFRSGATDLGESGWWSLSENKPPSIDTLGYQKQAAKIDSCDIQHMEGSRRRRTKTTLEAAMELKAKRAMTFESKEIRLGKRGRTVTDGVTGRPNAGSGSGTGEDSGELTVVSLAEAIKAKVPRPASAVKHAPVALTQFDTSLPATDNEASRASLDPSDTSGVETENSFNDSHLVSELSGDGSFINSSNISKSSPMESDLVDQDSQMSVASSNSALWLTERDLVVGDQVPQCLMMEDDGEETSDLDIDICAITPPESPSSCADLQSADSLPRMSELLSSLSENGNSGRQSRQHHSKRQKQVQEESAVELEQQVPQIKSESTPSQYEMAPPSPVTPNVDGAVREDQEMESEQDESSLQSFKDEAPVTQSQPLSEPEALTPAAITEPTDAESVTKQEPPRPVCQKISVYEEKQLLKQLEVLQPMLTSDPQVNRLRRKLIVRQMKRERGMAIFDADAELRRLTTSKTDSSDIVKKTARHILNPDGIPTSISNICDSRILDRYQISRHMSACSKQQVSFLNRLVGTEDDQQFIRSPYTARLLKPYIRRDYESRPQKVQLLNQIKAYSHRFDTTWEPPPTPPIDYCYVRPQHIPSINATCRQFFWPGIDLSECLQYPDFSCVVLYRKFIVGFAFMVPDVKYNEAYISFIFTHPEWRNAGIATFMLYHLIQTCMGKDVTLHVSASNTAMLLYQRFGFKPEEFILDFYDKYFPEESQQSRHAFFLRLRR